MILKRSLSEEAVQCSCPPTLLSLIHCRSALSKGKAKLNGCISLQSSGSGHELLQGEFPRLILSVNNSGEKKGRGEPEAGAEGHEDHHQGLWELDGVHDLLLLQASITDWEGRGLHKV